MKRWTRFLLSAAILAVCACLVWRAYHREPLAVFGGVVLAMTWSHLA